jgi:hypothetical protein
MNIIGFIAIFGLVVILSIWLAIADLERERKKGRK